MLWVSMYHQLQHLSRAPSQDLNDKMLTAVMEIVENVRDLESNPSTVQWGWYFHNDVQWPATVYLLNEIIKRPPDSLSGLAWEVLKQARDQWYENAGSKLRLQGMLFKPMRALTNRAFWVKEGKQPPLRAPMSNAIDPIPEFKISEDLEFNPANYAGFPEYSLFSAMPNMEDSSTQPDVAGFEMDFIPAPEQMENFMLPLWNQGLAVSGSECTAMKTRSD